MMTNYAAAAICMKHQPDTRIQLAVADAMALCCWCPAQAPEGLPPDVWCQLPYAILTAAKRRLSNTDPLEALGEHVEGAIKEVMHKATDFLWSFAELHRTQQQELRQQLIGVQAELAQQREQWQQEVAGLKGSLAAMAAQLQAMQQQLQQQQPGH